MATRNASQQEEPAGFSGSFGAAAGPARGVKFAEAAPASGAVVREVCEGEVLPKEAALVLASAGVGADVAATLQRSFIRFFAEAGEFNKAAFAIRVTDPNDTRLMKAAKELRLKLVRVRTAGDKERKALKEESLRMGRAIDSMGNCLKTVTEPAELYL